MASSSAAVGARAWIGFGEGGGGVELAGYALLSPPHFRLASRLVCCCLFIWGAGRAVGVVGAAWEIWKTGRVWPRGSGAGREAPASRDGLMLYGTLVANEMGSSHVDFG